MIDATKFPLISAHLDSIRHEAGLGRPASIALLSEFIAFIKEAEMTEDIAAERLRVIEEMQGDLHELQRATVKAEYAGHDMLEMIGGAC